jgi:uncharacterized protein DUF6766
MSEGMIVAVILVVGVGIAAVLIATMIRAIVLERRSSGISGIWANFGLSISFLALFLLSWVGQAVAEWGSYVQDVRAHGATPSFGDYVVQFGQSTLENWQSEFLQLFSFVVFSAILIHHGSAESKDGEDRIEQAVKRIEKRLDDAGIGSSASS